MNSVGDAFGFAFRDPKWVEKILIQGLILIIPIVGLIALAGWMLMTFDNIRAGRQELAPAGFHLGRGIGLFGAWFLYALVLSLPGDVVSGVGSGMNAHQAFSGSSFSELGSLLGLAGQALLYFLLPSLIVITYHRGFSGGMDVDGVWRLATGNVNNSVMAGLIMFVAGVLHRRVLYRRLRGDRDGGSRVMVRAPAGAARRSSPGCIESRPLANLKT